MYLEGGGSGLLGTLNYDFRFKENISDLKNALGLRVGIGLSPKYTLNPSIASHPVSTNGTAILVLVGINTFADLEYSHSAGSDIEFGLNFLYAQKNSIADKFGLYKSKNRFIPSLNIGYRSQPDEGKGFIWRICYSPYFLDNKVRQWAGISVGYHFN